MSINSKIYDILQEGTPCLENTCSTNSFARSAEVIVVVIKYMYIYFISIVKERGTNKKRERRHLSRIDKCVVAHTLYAGIRL